MDTTQGSPSALTAWRNRLRPWLNVIRDNLVIDVPALPSRDDMRAVWITLDGLPPRQFNPQPWTVVMEALELLDLLVRVDPVTGWRLVLETTRASSAFRINAATMAVLSQLRPRYRLLLEDGDLRQNPEPIFVALARLIDDPSAVVTVRESTAFQPTKRHLLELWKTQHGGRALDRETDGRIEIKPGFLIMSDLKSDFARFVIHRTRQLAIASRPNAVPSPFVRLIEDLPASAVVRRPVERPSNGRPFQFASIYMGFLDEAITSELAYVLVDMCDRELRISELELDHVFMAQLHTVIGGNFFNSMLAPRQHSVGGYASEVQPSACVERLIITSGTFDDDAVEALCSGIADSQCLKEVVFSNSGVRTQPPDRNQHLWWPWLAFALFGSTSTHQITSVTLDVRLNLSDVDAMRATLTHPNPLAYLCALDEPEPRDPPMQTPPMVAAFRDGAFMEMSRCVATTDTSVERTRAVFSSTTLFPIARDHARENYVEFMFAGTGVCWTERVHLLHQIPIPHRRTSPIQHLKLDYVESSCGPAIVELLDLVGASVWHVTLVLAREQILDDALIHAICVATPRLQRLDIEGDIASLNWLIDPPASNGRATQPLESFVLNGRVRDHASFLQFFQRLAEPRHPLAISLREFHFKKPFTWRHDEPLDAIWTHWLDMLAVNTRLERSEIDVSVDEDETAAEELAVRFRVHHGTQLRLREALAFLSVVAPVSTATADTRAMHRMDVEHVRTILRMANLPTRRVCG